MRMENICKVDTNGLEYKAFFSFRGSYILAANALHANRGTDILSATISGKVCANAAIGHKNCRLFSEYL